MKQEYHVWIARPERLHSMMARLGEGRATLSSSLVFGVAILALLIVTPAEFYAQSNAHITYIDPVSFPDLPMPLQRELQHRGCRIPQTGFDDQPHNVVQGEFHEPGQVDWAVLCTARDSSAILIYHGRTAELTELNRQPDVTFLQNDGDGGWAYSRRIDLVTARDLRTWQLHDVPAFWPPDHDGLLDTFVEKGTELLVWHGGWLRLPGGD